MRKEGQQLSEKEVKRAQITSFVEQAIIDPKLVLSKLPRLNFPDTYKRTIIDTAVAISGMSDQQVREEAQRLDTWAQESGYADNSANEWKSLIEQSDAHKALVEEYRKGYLPDSEIQIIVNTLLKSRVIKRKIDIALSQAESTGDFRKDPTKAALATNVCIHALNLH